MTNVQTGLQDMCYTNYNGTYYSSFIFTAPYRFDYSGENCNAANTLEVTYIDTSGACVHTGDAFATYSMSGTNADDDENDDNNGVGKDVLAIAIVFSFIGGVILTVVGVFCWFKFGKKPLGAQGWSWSKLRASGLNSWFRVDKGDVAMPCVLWTSKLIKLLTAWKHYRSKLLLSL